MAQGDTVVTVSGNLVADPEMRFLDNGTACCSFTVASTPRVFDKATLEWRDGDSLFMRCTVWRQQAESVAESLNRGNRVVVTGRLKQRSFEKDGQKRTVIELDADEVAASLKNATVRVSKVSRSGGDSGGSMDDPWGSAPVAGGGSDDAPF